MPDTPPYPGMPRWVKVLGLLALVVVLLFAVTYMETFGFMARMAADPRADLGAVRNASSLLHAALALLVLLSTAVLGIYKPRGMTPYGWRKQLEQRAGTRS